MNHTASYFLNKTEVIANIGSDLEKHREGVLVRRIASIPLITNYHYLLKNNKDRLAKDFLANSDLSGGTTKL